MDINWQEIQKISLPGEIWAPAPGYEELYLVSSLGRQYSLGRETCTRNIPPSVLKTQYSKKGYVVGSFYDHQGNQKYRPMHRMVAIAFIPNPENKPQVNHKNGKRDDNRVDNLEWATGQENMLHSFRVLGRKTVISEETKKKLSAIGKGRPNPNACKPVLKFDRKGSLIEEYKSITEAALQNNTHPGYIQSAVSGRRKSAMGFIWKYKNKK